MIFFLTLAVSPAARGALLAVIHKVGEMTFMETDECPGRGKPLGKLPTETMTLSKAQSRLPWDFPLPEWVPDGFVLQEDQIVVMDSPDFSFSLVEVKWSKMLTQQLKPEQMPYTEFRLVIEHKPDGDSTGNNISIGPESFNEVQVNGRQAGLVRGAWNAGTQEWDFPHFLTLHWKRGDLIFMLNASQETVSLEELIQIAESVP